MDSIKVLALLAVYNGEKFLDLQVKSLFSQKGEFSFTVLASDDGSSDNSISILRSYPIKMISGPHKGSAKNFLHLIEQASIADFYCFSDQDDVWDMNKIGVAIEKIKNARGPALYVGSSRLENGKTLCPENYGLVQSIMRNNSQGCTMVFNNELMDVVKNLEKECVLMHDWWLHIIAKLCGIVEYDFVPKMFYRIHDHNDTGLPTFKIRLNKYLKSIHNKGNDSAITRQILEIYNYLEMDDSKKIELSRWLNGVDANFYNRLRYVFLELRVGSFSNWLLLSLKVVFGSYSTKSKRV